MPGIEAIETALARGGADKVVVAMTDAPVAPLWAAVGSAWQGVVDHLRPRLVLFGAERPSAAELGPRTGARIGARLLCARARSAATRSSCAIATAATRGSSDSGAAVALSAAPMPAPAGDEDIDLVVLALPGGADARVELAGTTPAEVSHTRSAVVALGDDVADDAQIVADAKRLAALLGARSSAVRARARRWRSRRDRSIADAARARAVRD